MCLAVSMQVRYFLRRRKRTFVLALRLAIVCFLGSGGDLGWRQQLCAVQEIHHHLLIYGLKLELHKHSYASFGSCHCSPSTNRCQLQSYNLSTLEPYTSSTEYYWTLLSLKTFWLRRKDSYLMDLIRYR